MEGGSIGYEGGVATLMVGRSMGSSGLASLIEMTIFSRSIGVMCFSRPRLRLLSVDSLRLSSGRALGMRGVMGDDASTASSLETDSRLEERAGIARVSGCEDARWADVVCFVGRAATVVAREGCRHEEGMVREVGCESGAQQKVSRFHKRQLRFSSRRPFSIACEAFENKLHCAECVSEGGGFHCQLRHVAGAGGLTMPKRHSTDEVSISRTAVSSTRRSECCGRKGIVAVCYCVARESPEARGAVKCRRRR